MQAEIRIVVIALGLLIVILVDSSSMEAWGRGGGGRAGGFGGDYRGGYSEDSRGNWGNDARGRGDFGDPRDLYDQGMSHPVTPSSARAPESELRADANRTYNWSGNDRALSTDGDFGRMASATSMSTRRVTPSELAARGEAVRNAYGYPGVFNRAWWAAHPGAWGWGGWGDYWAWGGCGWPTLASWWGIPVSDAPTEYDYGDNITYQNDTVYYGSQPAESAGAYYSQAQNLAESVPVAASSNSHTQALTKNWKSLGVFSLVQGEQTNTSTMFELAVNRQGAIKGNYYNALTGEVQPVSGAVDKKRMRAAWTVGNNKEVVYDTGLENLLNEQSSVLVHFGKDKTQQWTLVRLKPKQNA
ncbi:MAG: hypothetical protein C5B53_04855 [Candidatus Melainabacteria bacterium]|nr:MAG: hypothetical protein C5B53_04855 [Candidatus Melainabacteria bacterium]